MSETRERILDAAAEVTRRSGMLRATTKEIAREAGYSEATLYKHWSGKEQLLVAVIHERFIPSFIRVLMTLPNRVGREPVADTLVMVARAAVASYRDTMPMAGALFGDPALLMANREAAKSRGGGPQSPYRLLGAYLDAEQQAGRISAAIEPMRAAELLIGACFVRAFVAGVMGDEVHAETDEEATAALVTVLMSGLAPFR